MSGSAESDLNGSQGRVDVVTGSTFEGVAYQIALDSIAFDHGGSASIRKGIMLGDQPHVVAVKVFGGMLDPVQNNLLFRELRAARMVSLRHPSILGFLGIANVGEQTAIVSFYMSNGNMMAYMKANPGCDKKKLIVQVGEAVEFLHGSAGLVHGDIKCSNVLISEIGNALLADFGLSTLAEKPQFATATMTMIRQMNTLQFAAPELLLGEGELTLSKTRETDVYAFGMFILEAMMEQPPWGMKSDLAVMKAVCSHERPDRETLDGAFVLISYTWWKICFDCWIFRPPIHHVLRDLRHTEPVPFARCRVLPSLEDIYCAMYTPNGRTLLAVPFDFSIVLCDIATGNTRHMSPACRNSMVVAGRTPAISPDGRHIAFCFEHTLLVLDAASGVLVTSISHGNHVPERVAYSPDGTRIASCANDGIIRFWDASTGAAIGQELNNYRRWNSRREPNGLSFSPDGICLASISKTKTIHLWDTMAYDELEDLTLGEHEIHSIEFSPVGSYIAAGDNSGTVFIWDTRERSLTHKFETEWDPTWRRWGASLHVAVSPLGRYVASGFKGGQIKIWDVRDGRQVGCTLDGPFRSVGFVAFSPDEKSLVSVADDGKVRVWDLFE